ncbi:hypothetical protein EJB05_10840 [Eragrostis curvula]|uniref:DUF6598 domain-containing protein n=1 Tax=Eragrostis curvula TaxID=38414 RepID=A0A5J9VMY7_9POAL|nr:hypothetical protein EJB05_10840 [Eragrostis curvula]
MHGAIRELQKLPVEAISRREYRRRLFATGRGERGAKASTEEEFGKNSSRQALSETSYGATARMPLLPEEDDIRDILVGEYEHPPIFGDILDILAGDSWKEFESPKEEDNKEDKSVRPRFQEPRLGEEDEFGWLSLFGEKDERSSPNFEEPRLGEEDECGCLCLFDEKDELGSLSIDPWWRRRMEVEKDGLGMRMEVKKQGLGIMMDEEEDPEMMGGMEWMTPSRFRRQWDAQWSGYYGSFEDTTRVPNMRFAKRAPLDYTALPRPTLQIFSVKLAAIRGGLKMPLDVFGMVATRDAVDHNRNIIFCRKRDNCQTLTEEDPYLVLTGPSRAVIRVVSSPVLIEVKLTVKGATEYEDKDLSNLVAPLARGDPMYSHLLNYDFASKLSTLEFSLGYIVGSVEATVFVRVIQGSWTDDFRGIFTASTNCFKTKPDIGHKKVILLDSGGEKVTESSDGKIKLSRSVVSVELAGRLNLSVVALKGNNRVAERTRSLKPSKDGTKPYKYKMGFCELLVSVVWSLLADDPVLRSFPVETTGMMGV